MPVAPSFQDLLDQGQAEALARRGDLLFADGDVSLAQLHAGAAMADANVRHTAQSFAATFIDLAKGDDLTALVDDHLNLQRQAPTAATVTVSFTRTSGGGAGSIPSGTVVATVQGADGAEIRFATTGAIAVGAGNNGPFTITATATTTGRTTNAAAGTITRILATLFDSTFSVTNAATAAGGNNEESDEQLRVRARAFWQTLRRGTLAALEFGALTVAAVRVAKASEDASGLVLVVVTDEDGNSNAEMVAAVEVELNNWRAAGCVVQAAGGTLLIVNVAVLLTVDDGVDIAAITPDLEDAITGRFLKWRMGDTVHIDQLKAAVINVDPDGINKATFSAPADDVVPTAYQVPRVGTITIGEA
jgi:hypothetical protein